MVIIMKKTNRIRILIFCAALMCGIIGYGSYRYEMLLNQHEAERLPIEANLPEPVEPKQQETERTVESVNITPPHQYVVMDEEGFLTVYLDSQDTVYMYTGIVSATLPIDLQQEIIDGKIFTNLEDLYRFLENYSS